MKKTFLLTRETSVTERQILENAAIRAQVEMIQFKYSAMGSSATTACLYTSKLTEETLERLDRAGIKNCQNEHVFNLSDTNPQKTPPRGWAESNYWNFQLARNDKKADPLMINLSLELTINERSRGVIAWPKAYGPVSPADHLPHSRMFQILSMNTEIATLSVINEINTSKEGYAVIRWSDIGLSGIRRIDTLFAEFSRGREEVLRLAQNQQIFDPLPFPSRNSETEGYTYIVEAYHLKLFDEWHAQLENYRSALQISR